MNKSLILKHLEERLAYLHQKIDESRSSKDAVALDWEAMLLEKEIKSLRIDIGLAHLNKHGGQWLGTAREWLKSRAFEGESLMWGSNDFIKLGDVTVAEFEYLASTIAKSAIQDYRNGLFSNKE